MDMAANTAYPGLVLNASVFSPEGLLLYLTPLSASNSLRLANSFSYPLPCVPLHFLFLKLLFNVIIATDSDKAGGPLSLIFALPSFGRTRYPQNNKHTCLIKFSPL
ncbi:uncharacterized protein F4812DRAFT_424130 [Daldinia caldariorum]|uniref:uncharacterized protein n=1 Tax=Daldinia caldariorum TaxID=326644 RepID=UPI002007E612|nr:uncharacterized protein F4812DRAFT_424130 [Daldinia caldariorum]KAI1468689.1 hypothetical protein F4812DRAFT_424130 [Daldinia caldariorum]